MVGRTRLLGRRVLARVAAPTRVGGLRLARAVTTARTPERIVETSTRLARGRSIARAEPAAPAAEVPRPPGMSEFAARWIFGDGLAEGIPIAGEAALADMVPTRTEPPSFIVERDAAEARAAEAEATRRSQPVQRGVVEEVPKSGFRLARKPAAAPPPPPPPPAAEAPAPPAPPPAAPVAAPPPAAEPP